MPSTGLSLHRDCLRATSTNVACAEALAGSFSGSQGLGSQRWHILQGLVPASINHNMNVAR